MNLPSPPNRHPEPIDFASGCASLLHADEEESPGKTQTQSRHRRNPGSCTETAQVPVKWRAHYKRLTELREALSRQRSELTQDALSQQPTFSTHMADAATDTYDRDFALGMLSSEQDALYQIDQAIDRIHNGTYGVCELTGKPIEPARLEAVPWTRFSAAAEKQIEREGARKRTRLGQRETVGRESPVNESEETA